MRSAFLLLALSVAGTAAAQTPPCFAMNDTTGIVTTSITSFGFAGQNTNAWQFTPTQTLAVQAAQIFTRNNTLTGDRFMILEIWSDNGGLPGTRLAGGTWKIDNSRPPGWQGADLDQVAIVLANTPAWLVWIDPGFSVFPTEPAGTTTTLHAVRNGSSWGSAGSGDAPKMRLFCGYLDDVHTYPFGGPCVSSANRLASVFTNDLPFLGNAVFPFEISGLPSGGIAFLALGVDATFVSIPAFGMAPGCLQSTDILFTALLTAGTGNTRGPTCAGYARLTLAIPGNPSLAGLTVAAQAVVNDTGATSLLPFVTSNAQRIVLF